MPVLRASEAILRTLGVVSQIGFVPTNPYAFIRCVATDTGRRFYWPVAAGVLGPSARGQ